MKHLIIIAFIIIFSSCNKQPSENKNTKFKSSIDTADQEERLDIAILSSLTDKLDLSQLTRGVDNFEMRIWSPHEYDCQKVIIIKEIQGDWYITENYFWQRIFMGSDTSSSRWFRFDVDSSKSRRLHPLVEDTFVDSLMYYTDYVRKAKELDGTVVPLHSGSRHIFEIATKNSYDFIPYTCGTVSDKIAIHKKVNQFLRFLGSQLSFYIPPCTD